MFCSKPENMMSVETTQVSPLHSESFPGVYPSPKVEAEIPDMEWLNVEKFPAELFVEPNQVTAVHDKHKCMFNMFNVGCAQKKTVKAKLIKDILYALQVDEARGDEDFEWNRRGELKPVQMTRYVVSPSAVYYKPTTIDLGEYDYDITFKTTDGKSFEVIIDDACDPDGEVMATTFYDDAEDGSYSKRDEYVYLIRQGSMCEKTTLSDGKECWMADIFKKVPEEVKWRTEENRYAKRWWANTPGCMISFRRNWPGNALLELVC